MTNIRLNHQAVQKRMALNLLRPKDLAGILGISQQLMNYVLHRGGIKYAEQLAVIFNCQRSDLLATKQPVRKYPRLKTKSHELVNNRLRRRG